MEDYKNFFIKIEELKLYIAKFEEIKLKVYSFNNVVGKDKCWLIIIITYNKYTFLPTIKFKEFELKKKTFL